MLGQRGEQAWKRLGERDPAFALPLPEVVSRFGVGKALELLMAGARILSAEDPASALATLELGRPFIRTQSETLKGNFWMSEVALLSAIAGPAAHLISEARESVASDTEDRGLELLAQARQAAPTLWEEHTEALVYFEGVMSINASVLAETAGNRSLAVERLFRGAEMFTWLHVGSATLDCLRRIDDLLSFGEEEVALLIVASLASRSLAMERAFGLPAVSLIQSLVKRAQAVVLDVGYSMTFGLFVRQISKGRRFAQVLVNPWTPIRFNDRDDQDMLNRVREAEDMVPRSLVPPASPGLLDEYLLTAYVGEAERRPGRTAAERMSNLQQTFDARTDDRLQRVSGEPLMFWPLEEVQQRLPERTALIDLYMGMDRNLAVTNCLLLITRESSFGVAIPHPNDLPDAWMSIGDPDSSRKVAFNPQAPIVQSRRAALLADPGLGRHASREALEGLQADVNRFLGPELVAELKRLRASGKDHLCFVPHGPTHYYPFHLLGGDAGVLCDDWIISYLPNLRLLDRTGGITAPWSVAALGLTFKGSTSLPELSDAEVTTIASIFDTRPLVDGEVTVDAFAEAVRSSRAIHVSTHGTMNTAAPAFQCLYLARDGKSDGCLFAYQILGMDLSAVDLLTLSACETALGRFDVGDNLRGLPAAFLLAGVATLIGTLWPVRPDPSLSFYSTFYEHLAGGADKIEAFRGAQVETRQRFPHYRDWGAFYFAGEWR